MCFIFGFLCVLFGVVNIVFGVVYVGIDFRYFDVLVYVVMEDVICDIVVCYCDVFGIFYELE